MNYVTIAEIYTRNGNRHLSNAIGYAARGLPSYSEGSERKGRRELQKARVLQLDPVTRFIAEALQRNIAKNIMETGA